MKRDQIRLSSSWSQQPLGSIMVTLSETLGLRLMISDRIKRICPIAFPLTFKDPHSRNEGFLVLLLECPVLAQRFREQHWVEKLRLKVYFERKLESVWFLEMPETKSRCSEPSARWLPLLRTFILHIICILPFWQWKYNLSFLRVVHN